MDDRMNGRIDVLDLSPPDWELLGIHPEIGAEVFGAYYKFEPDVEFILHEILTEDERVVMGWPIPEEDEMTPDQRILWERANRDARIYQRGCADGARDAIYEGSRYMILTDDTGYDIVGVTEEERAVICAMRGGGGHFSSLECDLSVIDSEIESLQKNAKALKEALFQFGKHPKKPKPTRARRRAAPKGD